MFNFMPFHSSGAGSLLRVLTGHPTYQRVLNEHLHPEEMSAQLANGNAVNNNGNVPNSNGSLHCKKFE